MKITLSQSRSFCKDVSAGDRDDAVGISVGVHSVADAGSRARSMLPRNIIRKSFGSDFTAGYRDTAARAAVTAADTCRLETA